MTTKKQTQYQEIERHGRNIQAIYPATAALDPVALCKKLHRLEAWAGRVALDLCNGDVDQDEADEELDKIEAAVKKLLGAGPAFFINRDPRGYALKISDEVVRAQNINIHRDWGGYGIICPEF